MARILRVKGVPGALRVQEAGPNLQEAWRTFRR
jgi:hypothetical protein